MKLPQFRDLLALVLVPCLSAVTLAQDNLASDARRLAM